MCCGCWVEYGEPVIDTPKVRSAADSVVSLYAHPRGQLGGAMHIVTDDWNITNADVKFCRKHIGRAEREAKADPTNGRGDLAVYAELTALEQECFDAFIALTRRGRASALGLAQGFWPEVAG